METNGTGFLTTMRGAVVEPRRFRTSRLRMRRVSENAPAVASARQYLRRGLPAIYHENDFGLRFVSALEVSLDPIVAVLDALPYYVSADLAPGDMLDLLAVWLGLEIDESWSERQQRRLIRHAGELTRRRGTRDGLELLLSIAFPGVPLRIEDGGVVRWVTDAGATVQAKPIGFVVFCDVPLPEEQLAAVARVIEQWKPANVPYRLRVKQPRKARGDAGGAAEGGEAS